VAKALDPRRLARLQEAYGDIVARRDRAARTFDLGRYVGDPVGFQREVLRDRPWSRQVEMAETVRDNPLTAVRGANSVGKDHEAAALAMYWAYVLGGLVVVTGPTQRQIDEIVFGREIKSLWRRSGLPGEMLARALRTDPDGDDADDAGGETVTIAKGILGFVSTDMAKLTGHHGARVMCVITEAQGVADMVFDAMFSNATGPEDRILAVANPSEPRGQFYRASRPNSGWVPIRVPATDHPNVARPDAKFGDAEWIHGGPSHAQLARLRATGRGPGTRYWTVFVEAQFPESATDAIVARAHVDAAFARWGGPRMQEGNGHEPVVGLDVARTGGDMCVAAPVTGPVVHPLEVWEPDPMDPTESAALGAERVMLRHGGRPDPKSEYLKDGALPKELQLGNATPRGRFIVDEALMGGGAIDMLRRRGWHVVAFNGSAKAWDAPEPGRFENLRAWGYYGVLKPALESGAPIVAADEALAEEIMATRADTGVREGTKIIPKKEIKEGLGRSPDRADAVMMAWLEANGTSGASEGGATGNHGI